VPYRIQEVAERANVPEGFMRRLIGSPHLPVGRVIVSPLQQR
jgi:hypothetical protein